MKSPMMPGQTSMGANAHSVVIVDAITAIATSFVPIEAAVSGSTTVFSVPVDVLDDHDRVVHEHAENEDEAEQHDHVQRIAHELDADERYQHRQRDRDRDEHRVPKTEERHQHRDHEDQTGQDVVLELVDHLFDLRRLVAKNGDHGAARKESFLPRARL